MDADEKADQDFQDERIFRMKGKRRGAGGWRLGAGGLGGLTTDN